MHYKTIVAPQKKSIALVAHDNMKQALIKWCASHQDKLKNHNLYATGTTGTLLEKSSTLSLTKLISGPLGGDQQIGAMIAEQAIDLMIFFIKLSLKVLAKINKKTFSYKESKL